MRIISGSRGGRVILPPKGLTTRPLPDRVKSALFSILGGHLPPITVADVFSGTGSFGLECLSRGASHAWFYERDAEAVRRLKRNLSDLDFTEQATVVEGDAFRLQWPPRWLGRAGPAPSAPTLVSLDPPYAVLEPGRLRESFRRMLARIGRSPALPIDAVVIVRHERHMTVPLDETGLVPIEDRTYGGMTLVLLQSATAKLTGAEPFYTVRRRTLLAARGSRESSDADDTTETLDDHSDHDEFAEDDQLDSDKWNDDRDDAETSPEADARSEPGNPSDLGNQCDESGSAGGGPGTQSPRRT